ncbi:MAG: hypothetical protein AAF757_23700 [Cyanobacteria bacterium P01_D01_bin.116]
MNTFFYLFGLISLSNVLISPVNAQQATARGSATLLNSSGNFSSVNAEIVLPKGTYFNSQEGFSLKVTPVITNAGSNSEQIDSLTLSVNALKVMTTSNVNPVIDATSEIINSTPNLVDTTTLIRGENLNNSLGLE